MPRKEERREWLDPARPSEFPRLEAFAAENGASLRRTERHRGLFPAGRTVGGRLHALAAHPAATARRARGALGLAALAALGFVLEILVGEKELLAGCPDERGTAVHAVQGLVLELHHYLSHSPLVSRHPDGTAGTLSLRIPAPERNPRNANPIRGAVSCASVSAPAPAWRG